MQGMSNIRSYIVWLVGTLFILFELFITNGFYGVSQTFQQQEMSIPSSAIGTLGFVSFLAYSICQVPAGIIASRVPTKLVVGFASLMVAIGIYIYHDAHTFNTLILSRVIISIGSSLAFVTVAVIISRWFTAKKFPLIFGLTQCFGNLSVVLANMFLPEIINFLQGWRNTGLYLSLFGIILFGLALVFIKTRPVTSVVTVVANQSGILDSIKKVLTSKQLWIASLYTGFLLGSLFNFGANWQINFQHSFLGNSIGEAALINSVMFLGVAIGNPAFGIISLKLKSRKNPLVAGTFFAVVLLGLLLFLPQLSNLWAMILCFLFGFCCSSAMLAYTIVMESLPSDAQGVGIGLCNTITYLMGAILSLIIGSILSIETVYMKDTLFADRVALSIFFFAILQAFTISLFLQESYGKD